MTGETEEEVLANAKKHGIDLTVPQAQMNLGIDNKELEEKYGKERFM
jgi:hypothetical protein